MSMSNDITVSAPPRQCLSSPALIYPSRNEAVQKKWVSSIQKIGIVRCFSQPTDIDAGHSQTQGSSNHLHLDYLKKQDSSVADNLERLSWRRMLMSREKLKASSTTSEILAAFALITMVELQINSPTEVPEWLFILFSVNTTVVVSLNVMAIMISTYLSPSIEAAAEIGHHHSGFFAESPHDRMKKFIELAWVLSNILGLLLFFVQLAILLWVKFWDFSFNSALAAMMIIGPFVLIFIGAGLYFYHILAVIKTKRFMMEVSELEEMKHQLDSVV